MTNKTKVVATLTALTLVTSCFIGGSIARYVTSSSSEDEARVAVWGINSDGVTMDLFDSSYDANGNVIAESNNGDNIIAPGTSRSSAFSIVNLDDTLAPEVMYEIQINVDDHKINQAILDNPSIQWKLNDSPWGTWEECKADILTLSGSTTGTKVYEANEIATNFTADQEHTISWQWLMDNGTDEEDTAMGNAAVNGNLSAEIFVQVTAVQYNGEEIFEVSPVANTSWKLNDTITDFSIFDTFDYENQTGWKDMPANTILSNSECSYPIWGFSMVSFNGLEIFSTVFSEADYNFYYVEENPLGLPTGWVLAPYTLVENILYGGTEEEIQESLAQVRSTEAPTISFPTESSEALRDNELLDWLKANATQID